MSETPEQAEFAFHETRRLCLLYTFTDSIKILFRNPKLFISISTLTIFPLSLLLFSLAFYCNPLKAQIHHLEELAMLSPGIQAGQIWDIVRVDSVSLLRLKALFWVPSYALSLLAMITAVNSTSLVCAGKRPNLVTAVTAARLTWTRSLVTSICVFFIMQVYLLLTRTVTAWVGWNACAGWFMVVLGAVLKVELMAVLSLGMVVSVLEEQFGWEAMRVAWEIMEGRRFCGWLLGGFLVLVSGSVGWSFRISMDVQDETIVEMMGLVDKVGFILLFGLIVLWSYVVCTVFYCECSKTTWQANRADSGSCGV